MKYSIKIKDTSTFVSSIDYNHKPYLHFNCVCDIRELPEYSLYEARCIINILQNIPEISSYIYIIEPTYLYW